MSALPEGSALNYIFFIVDHSNIFFVLTFDFKRRSRDSWDLNLTESLLYKVIQLRKVAPNLLKSADLFCLLLINFCLH